MPGHGICSVVGCAYTQSKCPTGTKFFPFPPERWFAHQRQLWITALKRTNKDGTKWVPNRNSLICSNHFVNGCTSREQENPSYVPAIFPVCYNKKSNPNLLGSRYARAQNRASKARACQGCPTSETNVEQIVVDEERFSNVDVGVQCDMQLENKSDISFMFVNVIGNEIAIQTDLAFNSTVKDSATNTDLEKCSSCRGYGRHHSSFCGHCSISDDDEMRELCGVTSTVFSILLAFLCMQNNCKVSKENRLVLFLMHMKLGISFAALGCIFNVHRTTASRIFKTVLTEIHDNTADWIYWPDRDAIKSSMPSVFKTAYSNCRAIIDCFELRLNETPQTVEQRVFLYSNYKCCYSQKFLIAITPAGYISFISNSYGGRSTDGFITIDSGFIKLIEAGDLILADKGFPQIAYELDKHKAVLVMPPFVHGGKLSTEEVEDTHEVESVRVHVERAIQRIRLFRVLREINLDTLHYINVLVHVCCVMANLQPPIIQQ